MADQFMTGVVFFTTTPLNLPVFARHLWASNASHSMITTGFGRGAKWRIKRLCGVTFSTHSLNGKGKAGNTF